jgi:hypothetical protein
VNLKNGLGDIQTDCDNVDRDALLLPCRSLGSRKGWRAVHSITSGHWLVADTVEKVVVAAGMKS